jgi:hypothetical protein
VQCEGRRRAGKVLSPISASPAKQAIRDLPQRKVTKPARSEMLIPVLLGAGGGRYDLFEITA